MDALSDLDRDQGVCSALTLSPGDEQLDDRDVFVEIADVRGPSLR